MTHEQDEVPESGRVEAMEVVNGGSPEDLHFRYIGTAKGRQFVVNVQFDLRHGKTGEPMRPIERGFMVAKVLNLVIDRATEKPDGGLH
jgi:hypothetical protein